MFFRAALVEKAPLWQGSRGRPAAMLGLLIGLLRLLGTEAAEHVSGARRAQVAEDVTESARACSYCSSKQVL